MQSISDYLVSSPKQILNHLKTLTQQKCLIAANFGENRSFLTAILEIDEKNQNLIIDCGPKEYLNRELLSLGMIQCKADLKGIKVMFEGREVKKAGTVERTALSIKIPTQLYWVQRRRFYRVRSPLSRESYCSISFQSPTTDGLETLNFKLFDLSATGFSIISESPELAKKITLDKEFKNCSLVLNETESHIISFIPRNSTPVNSNNPHKSQRIGCEFLNLPPRAETAFLRYMQEIERELKKNFD